MAEVKPIWVSLQQEVREVHIEDQKSFILRDDYDVLAQSNLNDHTVRLLPGFDPYLLGHADKNHLLDMRHYKRVYRAAGWISPVVLLNGNVIGVWSHTRNAHRAILQIALFEKAAPRVHAQIEAEAAKLASFWNTLGEIKFVK